MDTVTDCGLFRSYPYPLIYYIPFEDMIQICDYHSRWSFFFQYLSSLFWLFLFPFSCSSFCCPMTKPGQRETDSSRLHEWNPELGGTDLHRSLTWPPRILGTPVMKADVVSVVGKHASGAQPRLLNPICLHWLKTPLQRQEAALETADCWVNECSCSQLLVGILAVC